MLVGAFLYARNQRNIDHDHRRARTWHEGKATDSESGKGSIIDHGDGIIEYRQTGKLIPAFKINIADVTGFSVRKATKQDRRNGASALQQVIVV